MIYIGIFIALFAVAWLADRYQFTWATRAQLLYGETALLVLFAGLRNNSIGLDSADGYHRYFNFLLVGKSLDSWVEPLYVWMNKAVIFLGGNYQWILFLTALLCVIPMAYLFDRYTEHALWAMALYYGLYFYQQTFNIMRQCIAMSFCFLAVDMALRKKYIRAGLCMLVAIGFHKTAWIFFLGLLMIWVRFNLRQAAIIFLGTYLLGFIMTTKTILLFVPKIYQHYFFREGNAMRSDGGWGVPLQVFGINLAVLVACYACPRSLKNPWMRILAAGVAVLNLTQNMTQGYRLAYYFLQAQCLAIPEVLHVPREKNRKLMTLLFLVISLALFASNLSMQWKYMTPYRLFFMP